MRLGDANALIRLAAAGRGAKAPPANPATTLAAAVSACRRDNIVAAQIQFADGKMPRSLLRMYGAHLPADRAAATNCGVNLNREPKILSNLDGPITFTGQKNRPAR